MTSGAIRSGWPSSFSARQHQIAAAAIAEDADGLKVDPVPGGHGVDLETIGVLGYGSGRNLVLSCGMNRRYDTFTRLLGSDGEIRMTNPFHPSADDRLDTSGGRGTESVPAAPAGEPSFSAAIRHIHEVLGGAAKPQHLAIDTSLPTAQALHDLHAYLADGT